MASSFKIQGLGDRRLEGEIVVSGAKNAVLPALAASTIVSGTLELSNVPAIEDVSRMSELLEGLGANIAHGDKTISINAEHMTGSDLDPAIATRLRASIFLAGPLLARFGHVRMPHPGGDVIGARPIDLFLSGFLKLGAQVAQDGEWYDVKAPQGLKGADIFFPFISVGATETLMMAAVLASGTTTLRNAALEPEVVFLGELLRQCGAKIEGLGTPVIRIEGVSKLIPPQAPIAIIPDRIEAGTYLVLGALAASELSIRYCTSEHLDAPIELLRGAGALIEETEGRIIVRRDHSKPLRAFNVRTHEYPGFATDLQAPMTVLLTQAEGESIVFETIFEGRLNYAQDLIRMGADITPVGNHRIIIKGPRTLKGRELEGPDIRAGLAYVLASLVAEGESTVRNAYHIDRGYERVEEKLRALGASIERIEG